MAKKARGRKLPKIRSLIINSLLIKASLFEIGCL